MVLQSYKTVLFSRFSLVYTCFLAVILLVSLSTVYSREKKSLIEQISDIKEFKKILRTKNNVLVCFTNSASAVGTERMKMLREVSLAIRGLGTIAYVDCGEAKKMCKKLKISPTSYTLKHYNDGEYHKDYDRQEMVQSIVNFMKDPTGDLPWEEDPESTDVVHLNEPNSLSKLLRKENRRTLVMFYAPWCGFCKRLKPDYAAAATEVSGKFVLAAMDLNRPENSAVGREFNITGFPTIVFFENGHYRFRYEGENNKDAIVEFLHNPKEVQEKPKEEEWSDIPSEVLHLTTETFDSTLEEEPSLLVMFYAPWCGHCKKMKPEYMAAAQRMLDEEIPGKLAAVDATKESALGTRFEVKGYPTVKYFRGGKLMFDANVREADQIVKFMEDPQEPPPPPEPEKPWEEVESEVVHLTEETYKPFLKKKKHVLVIFYAPWCGHCKKAKPEIQEAAEFFKDDPKVEFAAVDCTKHQNLCSANDVKGYPTIKYFSYFNKNTMPYNGERTASEFIAFMEDPLNPLHNTRPRSPSPDEEWSGIDGSQHLTHLTDETFDDFMRKQESVLVMFYAPWCGHCRMMKPDYARAAEILTEDGLTARLTTVDATVQSNLQQRYNIRGFPTLKYFKHGRHIADYEQKRTSDDIVSFMKNPPRSKQEL